MGRDVPNPDQDNLNENTKADDDDDAGRGYIWEQNNCCLIAFRQCTEDTDNFWYRVDPIYCRALRILSWPLQGRATSLIIMMIMMTMMMTMMTQLFIAGHWGYRVDAYKGGRLCWQRGWQCGGNQHLWGTVQQDHLWAGEDGLDWICNHQAYIHCI